MRRCIDRSEYYNDSEENGCGSVQILPPFWTEMWGSRGKALTLEVMHSSAADFWMSLRRPITCHKHGSAEQ